MKITALQYDIAWADRQANFFRLDALLDAVEEADVYVLPEMFTTGFVTKPEGIAESDGLTLEWMCRKARDRQAAMAGSVAVEENGRCFNRFYFAEPDGRVHQYDKRHLFTYGGEQHYYTRGNERVVVTYGGVRFLLAVCYDLRFPVWTRNYKDYDVALYVANWPASRRRVWDTLLRARAIENQCYVVGVNRVGQDVKCSYDGGSIIIDPYGQTLSASAEEREETLSAVVDMEQLAAFRAKFPVLDDADLSY